jgi:hypothetical protein
LTLFVGAQQRGFQLIHVLQKVQSLEHQTVQYVAATRKFCVQAAADVGKYSKEMQRMAGSCRSMETELTGIPLVTEPCS